MDTPVLGKHHLALSVIHRDIYILVGMFLGIQYTVPPASCPIWVYLTIIDPPSILWLNLP